MTGSTAARGWPTIPDRQFFRIGEAARLVGVKPHVLRYWESEFAEIRPKKTKSKQRIYRRADIETLRIIQELLHERGLTHEGARRHLREHGVNPSPQRTPTPSGEPDVTMPLEPDVTMPLEPDVTMPLEPAPTPAPESGQSVAMTAIAAAADMAADSGDEESALLRAQVGKLREQLGNLTEDAEGLRARLSTVQGEVVDLRARDVPGMEEIRALLEKEVERLSRDLTDSRWTEEQLRLELSDPPQVRKLERQLEDNRLQSEQLTAALERTRSDHSVLNEEIEEHRRTTLLLRQEIEAQQAVTGEATVALGEAKAESAQLEERIRDAVPDAEYVARLEQDLSELRGSVAPLQADLSQAVAETEKLARKLEQVTTEDLETLRRDLSVAQDTAESLRLQLEAREDATIASELSAAVESAEDEPTALATERDDLLIEVSKVRSQLRKAEKEKDRILTRLKSEGTTRDNASAEVKALRERLHESMESIKESEELVRKADEDRKKALGRIEAALDERDVSARQADEAREQLEKTREELEQVRARTEHLAAESADERLEAEGLRVEADGLRVELGEMQQTLVDRDSAEEESQAELRLTGDELDSLEETIEQLERQSSADRVEVERLTRELGGAQEQLDESRSSTMEVEGNLADTKDNVSRLEGELLDERTVSGQLQDELDRVQRGIYDLSQEVEAYKAKSEANEVDTEVSVHLRGEVEELRLQLDESRSSMMEVAGDLVGTKDSVSRLEVELLDERTMSGQLQEELDRVQRGIHGLTQDVEAHKAKSEANEVDAAMSVRLRGEVEELRVQTGSDLEEITIHRSDRDKVAQISGQLRSAVLRLLETVEGDDE